MHYLLGEVAIVDARSGSTLGKLKQVQRKKPFLFCVLFFGAFPLHVKQHSKYSTRCHWNISCTLAASTSQVKKQDARELVH